MLWAGLQANALAARQTIDGVQRQFAASEVVVARLRADLVWAQVLPHLTSSRMTGYLPVVHGGFNGICHTGSAAQPRIEFAV